MAEIEDGAAATDGAAVEVDGERRGCENRRRIGSATMTRRTDDGVESRWELVLLHGETDEKDERPRAETMRAARRAVMTSPNFVSAPE